MNNLTNSNFFSKTIKAVDRKVRFNFGNKKFSFLNFSNKNQNIIKKNKNEILTPSAFFSTNKSEYLNHTIEEKNEIRSLSIELPQVKNEKDGVYHQMFKHYNFSFLSQIFPFIKAFKSESKYQYLEKTENGIELVDKKEYLQKSQTTKNFCLKKKFFSPIEKKEKKVKKDILVERFKNMKIITNEMKTLIEIRNKIKKQNSQVKKKHDEQVSILKRNNKILNLFNYNITYNYIDKHVPIINLYSRSKRGLLEGNGASFDNKESSLNLKSKKSNTLMIKKGDNIFGSKNEHFNLKIRKVGSYENFINLGRNNRINLKFKTGRKVEKLDTLYKYRKENSV